MTTRLEIYKCEICGNMVEMVHEGKGELVCCGQPMVLKTDNVVEASFEKHIPVVERISGGWKVIVGSDPHPMVEQHYIEWIELIAGQKAYRQFFKAGQAAEAVFMLDDDSVTARAYCNLHGLWKGN